MKKRPMVRHVMIVVLIFVTPPVIKGSAVVKESKMCARPTMSYALHQMPAKGQGGAIPKPGSAVVLCHLKAILVMMAGVKHTVTAALKGAA
jgi:hypothetical protein